MMKKTFAALSLFAFTLLAQAAPTPVGPALPGSGDGLNATWVNSDSSIHSIAAAQGALTNAGFANFSQVVPYINHTDGSVVTHFGGTLFQPAFDDTFVLHYTGYLNVASAGIYGFRAFTDDGFAFKLGGETITQFDGDRSPADSIASVFLDAGLYSLDFLVWEQGGLFVSELDWLTPGAQDFTLVPQVALFTTNPNDVPEPESLALLGLGLGLLAAAKRRKQ